MSTQPKFQCSICHDFVCKPCRQSNDYRPATTNRTPANDNRKPLIVNVAEDRKLLTKEMYEYLGHKVAETGISRRRFPDFMALRFGEFLEAGGKYVQPNGEEFVITDTAVDDAFNDSADMKWLSDWSGRCVRGEVRQGPQVRHLPRFRLIDLALRTPPCGFAE